MDHNQVSRDKVTDHRCGFNRISPTDHIKHVCRLLSMAIGVQILLVKTVLPIFSDVDRGIVILLHSRQVRSSSSFSQSSKSSGLGQHGQDTIDRAAQGCFDYEKLDHQYRDCLGHRVVGQRQRERLGRRFEHYEPRDDQQSISKVLGPQLELVGLIVEVMLEVEAINAISMQLQYGQRSRLQMRL